MVQSSHALQRNKYAHSWQSTKRNHKQLVAGEIKISVAIPKIFTLSKSEIKENQDDQI